MKKSKSSTLLRQISQLKLEVTRLQGVIYDNFDVVRDAQLLRDESVQCDYWHRQYWDLAFKFGVHRDKERVCRKRQRLESKKIVSQGLVEFEQDSALRMESFEFEDIHSESLMEFLDSEYMRELEREQEAEERYKEWANLGDSYDDCVPDPFYFEDDDIDDGGPY